MDIAITQQRVENEYEEKMEDDEKEMSFELIKWYYY